MKAMCCVLFKVKTLDKCSSFENNHNYQFLSTLRVWFCYVLRLYSLPFKCASDYYHRLVSSKSQEPSSNTNVVAELKVVFKLITLGVKCQECAAHSNKSNHLKLTLERNLLIVITAKR